MTEPEEWDHESTADTFMNDPSEVHAMWLGFVVSFDQLRRTPIPADLPEVNRLEIAAEYPYYCAGFFIGRVLLVAAVGLLLWAVMG